jgi:hypothetical protein
LKGSTLFCLKDGNTRMNDYSELQKFYKVKPSLDDLDLTGLPLWKATYTQAVYEGGKPERALYVIVFLLESHKLAKTNFDYCVLWEKATRFQVTYAYYEFTTTYRRFFSTQHPVIYQEEGEEF